MRLGISTITALAVGLSGNVFAAQTATQVSPSAINLSAPGVQEVTIHTLVDFGDCEAEVQLVDAAGTEFLFPNEELSLSADSLGHLVIGIDTWDVFRSTQDIAVGEAAFTIVGQCDGNAFEGMDEALITDNASEKKGR